MQHRSHLDAFTKRATCGERRKSSHTHDHFRLQRLHDPRQRSIANRFQRCAFTRKQFVRREVRTTRTHKRKRTPIPHEPTTKERVALHKILLHQPPESTTTHFTARACEPLNRSLRMHVLRLLHHAINPKKLTHRGNFTKRHPCLRHPERPRIHAKKQRMHIRSRKCQVHLMRLSRIHTRVVHNTHLATKLQRLHRTTQRPRRENERASYRTRRRAR